MQALLKQCYEEALANILERLIEKHEPLLRVENEGGKLTIREVGGNATMHVTIKSELQPLSAHLPEAVRRLVVETTSSLQRRGRL